MKNTRGHGDPRRHEQLRRSARERMESGSAPRASGGTLSADALALLYQRVITPESADESLKLLHELQVHQVELDLLYEQLQANEQEVTDELTYYKALYEFAPVAYLVVTNDGQIIEGNQAAGALFDEPVMALADRALRDFLAPGQEQGLKDLLQNSGKNGGEFQGIETSLFNLPQSQRLTVSARHAASGDSVLLTLAELNTLSEKS